MKNLRSVLETALVRFATWLLPKLSRAAILFLSRLFGAIAYAVDYRGRPTAHQNLRAAFAAENITPDQVKRIAFASYQTFALTFLDLFWSLRLNHQDYQLHLFQLDPSFLQAEKVAHARGSIWVTPHFGNFELISLILGFRGFRFTVVAQDFKNPSLTGIFSHLRGNSGHHIIPQQGAMLRLIKELKRQGHAAFLTDLNIKPNKAAAIIDCFGLKTCVTTLHATLSQRLGLPICASLAIPLADGGYRFQSHILEPSEHPDPASMTQAVWNHFEPFIRQTPENWLWMYKHWRYLPGAAPDPRYPAYANPSRPFRDLLASLKIPDPQAGAAGTQSANGPERLSPGHRPGKDQSDPPPVL